MIIKKQIINFILHLIKLLDKDKNKFYEVGIETRGKEMFLRVIMVNGLVTGMTLKPYCEYLFVDIFDFITAL